MDVRDQHFEMVMQSRLTPLLRDAFDFIMAMKVGEKVPATSLAEKIAERHNMKGPSFYPMLKLLIQDFPGIRVLRGARGGIEKLWDVEPASAGFIATANSPITISIDDENGEVNEQAE